MEIIYFWLVNFGTASIAFRYSESFVQFWKELPFQMFQIVCTLLGHSLRKVPFCQHLTGRQ